jgi:hypothetical protein
LQEAYHQQRQREEESEAFAPEPTEEERIPPAEKRRLEVLFEEAAKDRSKAFELKQELDRIGMFKEYEDRFLDLFTRPGESSG